MEVPLWKIVEGFEGHREAERLQERYESRANLEKIRVAPSHDSGIKLL